jgi:hypothetical protein
MQDTPMTQDTTPNIQRTTQPDYRLPEERLAEKLAVEADMRITSALHTIKTYRKEIASAVAGVAIGLGILQYCDNATEEGTQEVQPTSDSIGNSITIVLTASANAVEFIYSPEPENVLELELSEMETISTDTDSDASTSDIPISPTLFSAEAFAEYMGITSPKPASSTAECNATHCKLRKFKSSPTTPHTPPSL